nr:MAG TPA: hypothetical protein [Caudoviricetes sp.]
MIPRVNPNKNVIMLVLLMYLENKITIKLQIIIVRYSAFKFVTPQLLHIFESTCSGHLQFL